MTSTMTDTQIVEQNRVIAEFMGYYYHAGKYYPKDGGSGKWFKEARYHSDWNALMKCVEKIETFYLIFAIEEKSAYINNKGVEDDDAPWLEKFEYIFIEGTSKIEAAHKAVYDFVVWYNANTLNK